MGAKIGHSTENVEIHEYEIVGCVEQFVFDAVACQKPAKEGGNVEKYLQYECYVEDSTGTI